MSHVLNRLFTSETVEVHNFIFPQHRENQSVVPPTSPATNESSATIPYNE